MAERPDPADDPVAAYKALLRALVARRPSGTRQKMAAATGTHPSFISQITNPGLRVPLPAQHLPTIFRVCHFSPEEQAEFLALYSRAHPAQFAAIEELSEIERDVIRIPVPDLGDAGLRQAVEATIRDFAEQVIELVRRAGKQGDKP
jgi:DNA-binding transcriptional regulator YdaS (Cro superfamily)